MKNNKNMFAAAAAIALLTLHQIITMVLAAPGLLSMDAGHTDPAMQAAAVIVGYAMLGGAVLIIALLVLLAVKGFAEAADPSDARFHIILAQLMNVFYAISLVGCVLQLFKGVTLTAVAVELLVTAVYFAATLFYSITARRTRIAA